MLDINKIELYPDKLRLEEINGHYFLDFYFNDKHESLLIKINRSEIKCLSTELNSAQQKYLIASEYNQ